MSSCGASTGSASELPLLARPILPILPATASRRCAPFGRVLRAAHTRHGHGRDRRRQRSGSNHGAPSSPLSLFAHGADRAQSAQTDLAAGSASGGGARIRGRAACSSCSSRRTPRTTSSGRSSARAGSRWRSGVLVSYLVNGYLISLVVSPRECSGTCRCDVTGRG